MKAVVNSSVIACLSFVISWCSMVYELLLAQSLSLAVGQSFLRYTVVVGVYIFALGLGSLLVHRKEVYNPLNILIKVEIALFTLGAMIPVLIFAGGVAVDELFAYIGFGANAGFRANINILYLHIWVVIIGLLSGAETPLLLKIVSNNDKQDQTLKYISVDYLGSCLGAICFPIWILYDLGLVIGSALTSSLNVLVCLVLIQIDWRANKRYLWFCAIILLLNALSVVYEEQLINIFSQLYIL